ncbi:MAG: TlpA family protein disulfide reductase [Candidatus Avilachnospira sp.]|jgi:thiol-disulfide isomerase/thioredoxin
MQIRYRKKLKRTGILLAALLSALMLGACSGENGAEETEAAEAIESTDSAENEADKEAETPDFVAMAFESFKVKELYGEELTQDIFKDADLTMVNLWGTFCGPCINEMPELGELSEELKAEGRAQIIGIPLDVITIDENDAIVADDEMVEKAKKIVEETGAEYTHLIPEGDFGMLIIGSGAAQYVPTTFFVDSEGKLVGDPVVGAKDKNAWTEIINERLAEVTEE